MKRLTLCLSLLGLAAATVSLRADAHRFLPNTFYNTFSAAHPPAMRIKSGDRVVTATVDETGADAAGRAVASGPDPLTGPFYIEGAEPGDLIVVSIEKLEPNRTTGSSSSIMAAGSFDPGSLTNKPAPRVPWTIDKTNGVVRLDLSSVIPGVDWRGRYSSPVYELPLRPMLGSLGVAPAGQEGQKATGSGPFGGRLDFAGLTAGIKVMLPVFQPGALLFLGHGQARQGDGEVGGGGIATSMDVEFSVELVKKKEWPHSSVMRPSTIAGEFELGWPRVETEVYLMTIGSASTLLEAMQHATTELHHWLDDDFGFSERSLSIFMGQAVEYEIASIADQHFSVVAKVRRGYLPRASATE